MIRAAALLLALVAGAAAQAQGVEADGEAVGAVEAGIFCTERTGERVDAPGTVSGFVELVDETELRARTLTVPASPDLSFGYRAEILADEPDAVQILRHPPFRGIGATEQRTAAALRRGEDRHALYTFDHAYEMVEGPWSFEVVQDGRTLLSVVFEVVAAAEAPHLVGLCAGPPPVARAPRAPHPVSPRRSRLSPATVSTISVAWRNRAGSSLSPNLKTRPHPHAAPAPAAPPRAAPCAR